MEPIVLQSIVTAGVAVIVGVASIIAVMRSRWVKNLPAYVPEPRPRSLAQIEAEENAVALAARRRQHLELWIKLWDFEGAEHLLEKLYGIKAQGTK